jgi:hypothetical protein
MRNGATGILGFANLGQQFSPRAKVLYQFGVSQVPLEWFVAKVDFVHKTGFFNELGFSKWTDVAIELWLDENSDLFRAEQFYLQISSIAGSVQGLTQAGLNTAAGFSKVSRPF